MGELPSLNSGWELCATPAAACADPAALARHSCDWIAAAVPCTVASALRAAQRWSLDGSARNFDADDWWFRLRFDAGSLVQFLEFDGLATLAEVWLNGRPLLTSDNMHVAHRIDVANLLAAENTLHVCCRSLDTYLAQKRPRPRWRTPMVAHQQLRWARTTLLGRTPGWSPPAAAVGPWREVRLSTLRDAALRDAQWRSRLDGTSGVVTLSIARAAVGSDAAMLRVRRGAAVWTAPLSATGDAGYTATLRIETPALWWPHTHGEPARYEVALVTDKEAHVLGHVGFRTLTLLADADQFELQVNGERIFCRGACWTPLDPVTLTGSAAQYQQAVAQLRAAGMNMIRVGGTMVYEADAFYEACDQQGILIWQDFMFANMDYPDHDEAFAASVTLEARQFLQRVRQRPSLALLCGNSEGEQQAAMWGAARDLWEPPLFHERLRALAVETRPDVPYWPSSTHGGAFPHAANAGSTSYYGVGAYLRPLDDARRSDLRFGSEALAFANVPEAPTLRRLGGAIGLRVQQARWKERSPRDLGAGWDFDDVRDHYLRELFNVDPLQLRYAEHERYLACSREVAAFTMSAAMAEWRRPDSRCNGALIWFLRDLWDGAGWGIVDADGSPKAPWYALRRVLQPCALLITDEGNNGLNLHLYNERGLSSVATLSVTLYHDSEFRGETAQRELDLAAHRATTLPLAGFFDHFLDLSYAFRFGAAQTDLIHVAMHDAGGTLLAETSYLPLGLRALGLQDIGLVATAARASDTEADGTIVVTVQTRRYAHAVYIDAPGFAADDQYFPLLPGATRQVQLKPQQTPLPAHFRAQVTALNTRLVAAPGCKL